MPTGPDVSQHQGDIDFRRVKGAGHDFAVVKCSEGQDFRDPHFSAERVKAIREVGLTLGVYHFLRPRPGRTGQVEADWAVKVAKDAGWGKTGDIPLVCDVESTELGPADTARYTRQFLDRVEKLTRVRPLVYTMLGFASNLQGAGLERFPLWVAHWGVSKPTVPRPWKSWAIWQHTDKGSCPGISGPCDLNRAERLALIGPPPIPDELVERVRNVLDDVEKHRPKVAEAMREAWKRR